MGFKRDREKERLKKHKRDKKIAKARTKLNELLLSKPAGEQISLDSLSVGNLRRIVDNPKKFETFAGIHMLATTVLTERLLQLERER